MLGNIIWISHDQSHGIISVNENGRNSRYYLRLSRVVSAPDILKAGQYVRFPSSVPPQKPGLLPMAIGVEISDTPFMDGVSALSTGVQQ